MPVEKRGKLIVLDGIDGSGKTLQTQILVKRLKRKGYQTETLDFPQYEKNFFGKLVGRYLKGEFGNSTEIHPYLASVLYAADRWESSPKLYIMLGKGSIVVLNRYVSANQGHQGGKIGDKDKREKFLEWLDEMEHEIFGIPRPDLNILLHLNPEVAQMLIDKKAERSYIGARKRDGHESSLEHLRNTLECFLEIAEKNPKKWRVIYCTNREGKDILPAEEIHEEIWQAVKPVLINL